MIKVEIKSSLMEVTKEFTTDKQCLKYLNHIKKHHDKYNTAEGSFLKVNIDQK